MSAGTPNMYVFATAAQWAAGLLHGIDSQKDGALVTPVRYSRRIDPLSGAKPAMRIAANAASHALWLTADDEVQRIDAFGGVSEPDAANRQLLASPRWIADRDSLWSLDTAGLSVVRRALATHDFVDAYDVRRLLECCGVRGEIVLLDIAGDGSGGIWVLARIASRTTALRINCHGKGAGCVELDYGACESDQLAYLPRDARFVLLTRDGERLMFYDEQGELSRPTLFVGSFAPGWKAARLSDTGTDCIVVIGESCATPASQLFVLDSEGETVDGPFEPSAEPGTASWQALRDVAARGGAIWLAADSGVFRIQRSSIATSEFDCAFLTPPLESPEVDSRRGWLRAELDASLPAGAVVEAHFGWTKDERVATELRAAVRVPGMSVAERRALVWSRLDAANQRTYSFAADAAKTDVPIAIPLFEATERYLWLELRVVAPPDSGAVHIRALRVIYPNASLMDRLPAIYSDSRRDPGGAMRRVVGVLEATSQDIDERIRDIAKQLDPARAPAQWLDYMSGWFDLPWDPALPEDTRRKLLENAATLIAQRGTRAGLQTLLDILFGAGMASFVDLTADVGTAYLGAAGADGARLPLLLPGARQHSALLGEKAVLGRTRLPCDDTAKAPFNGLTGLVRIIISASPELRAQLEPLLPPLLDRFVPAGVSASLRWREPSAMPHLIGASYRLDGPSPARVGSADARLGSATLAGALPTRLADPATHVRLKL